MIATYRVLYSFARLADALLINFVANVILKMTGHLGFPNPRVDMSTLRAALDAFSNAVTAALAGGRQLTAAKNQARDTLLMLLRQEGSYVQSVAGEDLALLLSSGFEASSKNRAQIPLPQPVIERIDNPQSTMLAVTVSLLATGRAYEVRIKDGANGWTTVGVFTYSRSILVTNLTPGTVYTVQVRGIGGSLGYSDWSDPVSHMAM
ncbi:MAG TPA: fibronectin type III domain-containing protein [Verrucomicrobiae bacterium]|jgi:hypothetical protein